jgi:CubicO group peptidase (beta-lactamase class C family)
MKIKLAIQGMLLHACLLVMLTVPAWAMAKDTPDPVDEQIRLLSDALEAKRLEHHIPGMAIAVIKDQQVILARGFGHRDIDQQLPVTTDTLFAIGSTSKALSATLIGTLVDEGSISWDDELTEYLPEYRFVHEGQPVPITFRDALSHRSGYSRNDLLWANGQASRELILSSAPKAEPWDEFRKNFHYNNVMYLAAGMAAATAKGTAWDQWLADALFKPLNMQHTTSIHQQAMAYPQKATGYVWNDATETHLTLPRRNLNNVTPAGGIWSHVNDMAKWLQLLLNEGHINKQTIISGEQLKTTWTPQIGISRGVDYGLGWFLRSWQGQPVVEHGGSVDGYAAQVALLPEENLGFVLLTNVTSTPLQQESMNLVFSHLVDTNRPAANSTTEDLQPLVGEYHANFASFKDQLFTVLINDQGHLAVDVPGQTVYELLPPDAEGKRYFTVTDTVAVSFDYQDDGQVAALRMHQNRLAFELPRKGVTIEPETDPALLQPYLGRYQSKLFNGIIEVFIQNHRLTLDVPNEMAFELHLPDEQGFRQFRVKADMSARFIEDDNGSISGLELYRDRSRQLEQATKITDEHPAANTPTVAEVLALGQPEQRQAALKAGQTFVLRGTIKVLNSGVTGAVTTTFDATDRFQQHMDFGPFGSTTVVVNQDAGASWGINPYTELHGKYLRQIQREHPAVAFNLQEHFSEVQWAGSRKLDNREVHVLRLKDPDLPPVTVMLDAGNGDLLRYKTRLMNMVTGAVPMTIEYADHRDVHGLRVPFRTTITNPMMGKLEVTYTTLEAGIKPGKAVFSTAQPRSTD